MIPEFLRPNTIFTVAFARSIHDANAVFATATMIGRKKKEESSLFPHKMAHLFLYNLHWTKIYIVVVWIFINLMVQEGGFHSVKHCGSLMWFWHRRISRVLYIRPWLRVQFVLFRSVDCWFCFLFRILLTTTSIHCHQQPMCLVLMSVLKLAHLQNQPLRSNTHLCPLLATTGQQ